VAARTKTEAIERLDEVANTEGYAITRLEHLSASGRRHQHH
jgi:hypothetical protein